MIAAAIMFIVGFAVGVYAYYRALRWAMFDY
jgi:hypothetical protein